MKAMTGIEGKAFSQSASTPEIPRGGPRSVDSLGATLRIVNLRGVIHRFQERFVHTDLQDLSFRMIRGDSDSL